MPRATDQQVQQFVNERIRPIAELVRAVTIRMADDEASIADIFEACANNPTWTDNRTDGPPHLLAPNDVLSYNSVCVLSARVTAGTASAQDVADLSANLATLSLACVRPVQA